MQNIMSCDIVLYEVETCELELCVRIESRIESAASHLQLQC